MITANIISRVFRILHNERTGAGYVVEIHGNQHMVSAANIFKGSLEISHLQIFHQDEWRNVAVTVAYNTGEENGDTIVFRLLEDICQRLPVRFTIKDIIYSQQVYFLGFPFGISINGGGILKNYPMPFVKSGILSAIDGKSQSGITAIYIDGHNNEGFSGGPVVICPQGHGVPGTLAPQIIGTVSGFISENVRTSSNSDNSDLFKVNAGIIKAYWIRDIESKIMR